MGRDSLIEPSIGHNEEALVAGAFAPRILNFVSNRPSIRIKVNGGDNHRMRHRALCSLEALRLG